MSDVLNPVQVEQAIQGLANRIGKGVRIVSNAYATYLDADRAYEQAFARAYMAHDGPAHEKRYAAELATEQQRAERDKADVAYRYADRTAKALENELRAYQSIGASVRTMYASGGAS